MGSAAYWYLRPDICAQPLDYHIAQLDVEFGLSQTELNRALLSAEYLWENPTFLNFFNKTESRGIAVRLVYDQRQSQTQAEQEKREFLDKQESRIDSSTLLYVNLVEQLTEQERSYEKNLKNFQQNHTQYSQKKRLEEKDTLLTQQDNIQKLITRINSLVVRIETNVNNFNQQAKEYNKDFAGDREFDQGHYDSKGEIVIYQYDDLSDLSLILAHEFGHALGMDHVTSPQAVMNAFLTHQDSSKPQATDTDLAELARVCKAASR